MNPLDLLALVYPLDLKAFAAGLPVKLDKDERRIKLFLAAVQKKELELLKEAPSVMLLNGPASDFPLVRFNNEARDLTAKWILRAKRLSFADLFRGDPYKDLRQETRVFAAKWNMDATFRAELG